MSLDYDIELLARQPLFVDFSVEQLRLIAFGSQKLSYSQGAELFYHDQPADCGYLIISGEVAVELPGHSSAQNFGVGDLIGEMSLLTRNRRVGTATVLRDCQVLRVSRSTMHRILEEYPELAALIHDRISSSVVGFTDRLEPIEKRLTEIKDA